MEYASKNILLNLHSVLRETVKGIKEADGVGMKLEEEDEVKKILQAQGLNDEQIRHIIY